MPTITLRIGAILAMAIFCRAVHARVPDIISYQGRVQVNGTNFTGTGQFKFVLLKGASVMWRSSADGNADGQPDQAVTLPVTNGLFVVGLGDSSAGNMASLSSVLIPFDDPGSFPVTLRIWFSDGVNGFAQLAPDQPLQSTAYAQEAKTVPAGSIGAAQLANGSVGSNQIANGSIGANKLVTGLLSKLDAPDGNPLNVVRVETNGNVIVTGSGSEAAFEGGSLVTLKGTRSGPLTFDDIVPGLQDERSGVTNLAGANSIALSGNIAFVTARDDDAVTAINITDPTSMTVLGGIRNGGTVTSLNTPEHIVVSGNFAYVASSGSDSMTILNVANPGAITVSSFIQDGAGGFNHLNGAAKVAVNGNFAYVLAPNDNSVTIVNVANKSAPTLAFVITNGVIGVSNFNTLSDLQVVGNRLYVMANIDLWIFDVTSPAAPSLLFRSPGSFGWTIEVVGNMAYIGDSFGEISIYDVTTASAPVLRSRLQLLDQGAVSGFSVPDVSPSDMVLEGTTLYVAMPEQSRLYALDVSDPLNPRVTHYSSAYGSPGGLPVFPGLLGVTGLATVSNRVFVASIAANTFQAFQKPTSSSARPVSMVMDGSLGVGTRNPAAQLHVVGGSAILETSHLTFGQSTASGNNSAALGSDCLVTGFASFALGRGLEIRGSDSIAVGKFNFVTNALFTVGNGSGASSRENALTVLANGNIGLEGVYAPTNPIQHISGARLTAGGTWTSASDVNLKENLKPVTNAQVLERISELPVYEWNYKVEGPSVRHLGPTAQDFRAAFGLGNDDKSIATLDESGVAIAAIQELIQENKRLRERVEALEKRARP